LANGLSVPDVPGDLSTNFTSPFPWNRQTHTQNRFFVRSNYLINDDWSASIAYGEANGDPDNGYFTTFGSIVDDEGNVDLGTYASPQDPQTGGGIAKLDGEFEIGDVYHRLSLSATLTFFDFTANQEGTTVLGFSGLLSNIYNPPAITSVTPPARNPADLFDVEIDQDIITYGGLYEVIALEDRLSAILGVRRVTIETDSIFDPAPYKVSENTFLASLSFKPNEDSTIYGSYSEGAEAGLFAPFNAANANEVLPVTTPTQFEIGGKYQFGDALLSAAYFAIERPTTGLDENNIFRELGDQDFTGIEVRAEGEVFNGFRTVSGLTFYDVEISSTDASIDGKTLAGIPDFAASAYVEYDITGVPGLTVTTGITYEGRQFLDNTNIDNREADAWTQIDFGVRYSFTVDDTSVTTQLFVENITDKGYWNVDAFGELSLSIPRTLTATISADF
ncbi:MAG: TonB-dependent receptor, partial [Pseudomonadota bacterium]